MQRKITIIGRANTGKTSIKRVFFEGVDSKEIILHTPEPTRGIDTNVYAWLDLEVGLFDTSGQELPFFLENNKEKDFAFNNANTVIYLMDYPTWTQKSSEIMEEIEKLYNILNDQYLGTQLIIIFHKIDLINQKIKGDYQIFRDAIRSQLKTPEIRIYFTSIHPELIMTLFNSFSDILSNMSGDSKKIKEIMDMNLKPFSKTISVITDKNDCVLTQSFTQDFDINLIFSIQKKLNNFIQSMKSSLDKEFKINFVDGGGKVLRIINGNINHICPVLNNLICLSEDFNKDKIIKLFQGIKEELETLDFANK